MIRLVQIGNGVLRRVALVDEPYLRSLTDVASVYELTQQCLRKGRALSEYAQERATGEVLNYDDVYGGKSQWKLLAPIDVPGAVSKLLVAGTGLTHLGSAKERQAMHIAEKP